MSYSEVIMNNINKYSELKIIDAQRLYYKKYKDIPEQTFFKILSRMENDGVIRRISRGIYCKPKQGKFGLILPNEKNILEHYVGKNNNKGILVGYGLFNKYGLTTQISKTTEVYSTEITKKCIVVKNIKIQKINMKLDVETVKTIQLLEILQQYKRIEDLNIKRLSKYLEEASKSFDEKSLNRVLRNINYKKSTIASLESVLNYYGVKNSVSNYLNGTSKYKTIHMEDLYALTL